ncbi:Winged helix DNA-binding domain-containing protein [Nocardia amikacinitolerans]|uniref:DNA glycosylase AlkZ-like family protein n=1 Tax=Nocardia amikacinitolerans TaxID=756689 RepID=UPI000834E112|nr:crosslink repair DNA glycosylase YcaQ family protein [Nocardia amikacinitolerans]MCP2321451.1 Winged helix DNA-binding domain-containing protein [Nocardia amikacinitolerans]
MAKAIAVGRAQWLGYRWRGHGLNGRTNGGLLDDLLLLGFQDGRFGGAAYSLRQRTDRIGSTSLSRAIDPAGPLVSWWTLRGAPHAHRLAQLDVLRDALAPRASDEGGAAHAEAVAEVAAALRAVVTRPTPKSAASTAVTGRVSSGLTRWCDRCRATHVPDGLFRAAGCHAQIVLGPEVDRATMLYPTPDHPAVGVQQPRLALLRTFFRVNGPTTRPLFRDWLGVGVDEVWREVAGTLVRVQVDDRRYEMPESLVDAVLGAGAPEGVVLVPPGDPYLRQADRALLVPDSARRREVWRALSAPGAVLVDGEVVGVWRYRRAEHRMVVSAFDKLSRARRGEVEGDAVGLTGDERLRFEWE